MDYPIRVISLTGQGLKTARRLAEGLEDAQCLGPADRISPPCRALDGSLKSALPDLWRQSKALVFVAAAGMVVRLIAPLISDKKEDPAVVVVDQTGRYAVSLLSGHLGGANQLAQKAALILDGQAVITTATDNLGLPGWDMLARENNLAMVNPELLPELTGQWLDGREIFLIDNNGLLPIDIPQIVHWTDPATLSADKFGVYAGCRKVGSKAKVLILRPKNISVGLGCHRDVKLSELENALAKLLSEHDIDPACLAKLASVDKRKDTPALFELADKLDLPLEFFKPEILAEIKTPNPSPIAQAKVNTPSVCEAAALTSWANAQLIVEKTKWPNLTMALARAQ